MNFPYFNNEKNKSSNENKLAESNAPILRKKDNQWYPVNRELTNL